MDCVMAVGLGLMVIGGLCLQAWQDRRSRPVSSAYRRDLERRQGQSGWDGPSWRLDAGRKSFDEGWRK